MRRRTVLTGAAATAAAAANLLPSGGFAQAKTTTVNSGLVTTVETYDANGNLIRQASTGGGVTSTTDITIASTQQVCR